MVPEVQWIRLVAEGSQPEVLGLRRNRAEADELERRAEHERTGPNGTRTLKRITVSRISVVPSSKENMDRKTRVYKRMIDAGGEIPDERPVWCAVIQVAGRTATPATETFLASSPS
jgi:hypothetical protein